MQGAAMIIVRAHELKGAGLTRHHARPIPPGDMAANVNSGRTLQASGSLSRVHSVQEPTRGLCKRFVCPFEFVSHAVHWTWERIGSVRISIGEVRNEQR